MSAWPQKRMPTAITSTRPAASMKVQAALAHSVSVMPRQTRPHTSSRNPTASNSTSSGAPATETPKSSPNRVFRFSATTLDWVAAEAMPDATTANPTR